MAKAYRGVLKARISKQYGGDVTIDKCKKLKGNNQLSEYSFGTKQAKHLFCKSCGMKSFYQPRSHPDSYSVNLKCVDKPPKVMNIVNFDGENEYK